MGYCNLFFSDIRQGGLWGPHLTETESFSGIPAATRSR